MLSAWRMGNHIVFIYVLGRMLRGRWRSAEDRLGIPTIRETAQAPLAGGKSGVVACTSAMEAFGPDFVCCGVSEGNKQKVL